MTKYNKVVIEATKSTVDKVVGSGTANNALKIVKVAVDGFNQINCRVNPNNKPNQTTSH